MSPAYKCFSWELGDCSAGRGVPSNRTEKFETEQRRSSHKFSAGVCVAPRAKVVECPSDLLRPPARSMRETRGMSAYGFEGFRWTLDVVNLFAVARFVADIGATASAECNQRTICF